MEPSHTQKCTHGEDAARYICSDCGTAFLCNACAETHTEAGHRPIPLEDFVSELPVHLKAESLRLERQVSANAREEDKIELVIKGLDHSESADKLRRRFSARKEAAERFAGEIKDYGKNVADLVSRAKQSTTVKIVKRITQECNSLRLPQNPIVEDTAESYEEEMKKWQETRPRKVRDDVVGAFARMADKEKPQRRIELTFGDGERGINIEAHKEEKKGPSQEQIRHDCDKLFEQKMGEMVAKLMVEEPKAPINADPLDSLIAEREGKLQKQREEEMRLTKSISEKSAEERSLGERLKAANELIQEEKVLLDRNEKLANSLTKEQGLLKQKLDEMKRNKVRISKMLEQAVEVSTRNEQLKADNAELEQKVAVLKDVRTTLKDGEKNKAELEAHIAVLAKEKAKLEEETKNLKKMKETKDSYIEMCRKGHVELTGLTEDVRKRREEKLALNEDIGKLRAENKQELQKRPVVEELKQKLKKQTDAIASKDNEITQLNKDLEDSRSQATKAKTISQKLRNTLSQLKSDLPALKHDIEDKYIELATEMMKRQDKFAKILEKLKKQSEEIKANDRTLNGRKSLSIGLGVAMEHYKEKLKYMLSIYKPHEANEDVPHMRPSDNKATALETKLFEIGNNFMICLMLFKGFRQEMREKVEETKKLFMKQKEEYRIKLYRTVWKYFNQQRICIQSH